MWLVGALAWAQEAVSCDAELPAPPEALSVAWVSPLGKKVGKNGWLTLTPTQELRSWARAEADGSVARLLQRVGLRKRAKEPKRAYKVVIFDVRAEQLCRPLADREGGEDAFGMVSCIERATRYREENNGCGLLADRAGGDGPVVYRARWRDVVRNGFCVLPAERFLQK